MYICSFVGRLFSLCRENVVWGQNRAQIHTEINNIQETVTSKRNVESQGIYSFSQIFNLKREYNWERTIVVIKSWPRTWRFSGENSIATQVTISLTGQLLRSGKRALPAKQTKQKRRMCSTILDRMEMRRKLKS